MCQNMQFWDVNSVRAVVCMYTVTGNSFDMILLWLGMKVKTLHDH